MTAFTPIHKQTAATAKAAARRELTLTECRTIVAGKGVDYGIFGRHTPEELTAAVFAIAGRQETTAQIRARREAEASA
jgi:hypothetical protein